MPWWENSIIKFNADGMIHTTGRERHKHNGRKDILNEITYKDAYVCLTCPYEECSGERECFLGRKKEIEKERKENAENGE